MTPETLSRAMGARLSLAEYARLSGPFTEALERAQCNTVRRVAMFCAQVGHESSGLYYRREIASGAAYEGRRDLGNVHRGDGMRFAGRGPIQLTGRHNYTRCSEWAYALGFVPTRTYFVDHPEALEKDEHLFTGAVWYWRVARDMNAYADRGDILGATKAVNGGTNGLSDRTVRWKRCLAIGQPLLEGEDDMPYTEDQLKKIVRAAVREETANVVSELLKRDLYDDPKRKQSVADALKGKKVAGS